MPVFDTERVWTFGFWQSQINFMTYRIDLGIGIFNLIRIMDGQPLCFCSSTRAGHILFRMEVWHQELMKGAKPRTSGRAKRIARVVARSNFVRLSEKIRLIL